jgi:serine/threonine protein kinase
MTADLWLKVTEVTADAMELPREERRRFLEAAVSDKDILDQALRLVEESEKFDETFLMPIARLDARAVSGLSGELRTLPPGTWVDGRFRIVRFVAHGGMGQVYEAWDSIQETRVALKTIRPDILSNASSLARFREEVVQALKVSHRNVCRVQNLFVCEDDGEQLAFLTMQFLDGETLAERLARGPMRPEEALPLVAQIANGLSAAHEVGVIHRDLKSRNIMLVPENGSVRAVVMDFGLACAALDGVRTVEGTPAYMAPEQLSGGRVTDAADQYAFGVVLFEMVTGRLPYSGNTFEEIAAQQASARNLSPRTYTRDLPDRWVNAIVRCLAKRPEQRFAKVTDVLDAIQPKHRGKLEKLVMVAAAVALTLTVFVSWRAHMTEVLSDVVPLLPSGDYSDGPSLSADGNLIAYESNRADPTNTDIWVQDLRSGEQRRLTTDPAEDSDASMSPDGKLVAFRSERDGGGVYVIGTDGKNERLLVAKGRWPKFSPDGRRIAYWTGEQSLTASAGSFVIAAEGGPSQKLFAGFADSRTPIWNADGHEILARACKSVGSPLYSCDWWVDRMDSSPPVPTNGLEALIKAGLQPFAGVDQWVHGKLYLPAYRGSNQPLVSLPINREYHVNGPPNILTSSDIQTAYFSRSRAVRIAFSRVAYSIHVSRVSLSGKDHGLPVRITNEPEFDCNPSASADGRWLVFSRGIEHIVLQNLATNKVVILAAEQRDHDSIWLARPIINRTGERIVYEERTIRGSKLRVIAAGGKEISRCGACGTPSGWSKDGSKVYFTSPDAKIAEFDTIARKVRTILERDGFSLDRAAISPSGQFLLFTAARGIENKQIFAVRWNKLNVASGDWIPITGLASWADAPQWSSDGNQVFYLSGRDGHPCVWRQGFVDGKIDGAPVEVLAYHETAEDSPSVMHRYSFSLAVAGNNLFLNVGQRNSSVLVGLMQTKLGSWLRRGFLY